MGTYNFSGKIGLFIIFEKELDMGINKCGHFLITKTLPCPNTCLTKMEGYDHILRFEMKVFFFGLNPQCDAHNFAILAGKYLQLEYLENQLQCDRHLQPPQGHHFSSYVGRHS